MSSWQLEKGKKEDSMLARQRAKLARRGFSSLRCRQGIQKIVLNDARVPIADLMQHKLGVLQHGSQVL